MTQIRGSLFIVTGAASGIGRACAMEAARRGADVVATDVDLTGLQETQAEIKAANGSVETERLDVSDRTAPLDFGARILQKYPRRRIVLLNNAGVALGAGAFEETPLEDFEWLLNINLWGVIRTTKAFISAMTEVNEGHIANVSSVFGMIGAPDQSAYCTAKFGVRGFTEVLRNELRDTNVQVSAIFPGGVSSNIAKNTRVTAGIPPEEQKTVIDQFAKSAKTTPAQAAKIILDGIEKNKDRILVGADARLIDFLSRYSPVGYARIVVPQLLKTFRPPNKTGRTYREHAPDADVSPPAKMTTK